MQKITFCSNIQCIEQMKDETDIACKTHMRDAHKSIEKADKNRFEYLPVLQYADCRHVLMKYE